MTTKTIRTATPAKAAARTSKTASKKDTKPSAKRGRLAKAPAIAARPAKRGGAGTSAGKGRVPVAPATSTAAAPAVSPNKQARLIALLRSPKGGTIEQMTTLTGWQAHTVRGTISGVLRKRLGLNVACAAAADDGVRVYRIVEARAA